MTDNLSCVCIITFPSTQRHSNLNINCTNIAQHLQSNTQTQRQSAAATLTKATGPAFKISSTSFYIK